uniref:Uncharacterized protein MANES_06G036300 n=1 Tax=Rhizophora mucronata TaxID=61149 RepID=A0A2P2M9C3_RHIMU
MLWSFNMSMYCQAFLFSLQDGDLKYSLYGVLVHYGHNTHSGHYVCFVCTSSGIWYLLNDNEVHQVSEKHVLEQKAYMLFYVRERKNVALRRPINVIPKEHMKAAFHNNANLVYRSFRRESVSSRVNGSHTADCSAGDKMNISNVGPVREIFAKEASARQKNEVVNPECTVLKQDPVLGPSSSAPLLKDMSKCDYSGSPGLAESLSLSGPSVNSNNDTPKLEHASSINGAKFSDSDEVTFCSTGSPQNPSNGKLFMNVALQQINHGLDVGDSTDVLPGGPCDGTVAKVQCSAACLDSGDKPLDNIEPVKASYKTSCSSSQVDSISSEQPAGNILHDHVGDASKEISHHLVNSSIPLVVPNECLHGEQKTHFRPLKSHRRTTFR